MTLIRNDQSYWFKDAFETIKTLPQIKAAIVWDVINVERGEDFTFNDDTLKMFGQIFKDPYFIGTK